MGCSNNMKVIHEERKHGKIDPLDQGINNIESNIKQSGPDEITLIYRTNYYKKGDKMKLFGEQFVKNNKNK